MYMYVIHKNISNFFFPTNYSTLTCMEVSIFSSNDFPSSVKLSLPVNAKIVACSGLILCSYVEKNVSIS